MSAVRRVRSVLLAHKASVALLGWMACLALSARRASPAYRGRSGLLVRLARLVVLVLLARQARRDHPARQVQTDWHVRLVSANNR